MGEIAEMMLDGILDANGEYTGRNPGHPVYPKGWFGSKCAEAARRSQRVRDLMTCRGIAVGDAQRLAIKEYGISVDCDRPTNHACSNWPTFKAFINARVGYIKPSNLKS
jgi:hypothetical protein